MSNGYYSNGYSNGYYANGYTNNNNSSRGQVTYASQDEQYPSVFESSSESGGEGNNNNDGDGNDSTSESEDGPVQTTTCTCTVSCCLVLADTTQCCDHNGREYRETGYNGQRIN